MALYLSPGLYYQEKDLSGYVQAVSTATMGMVAGATRGPMNTPTRVSDQGSLERTFGLPVSSDYGLYGAQQFLRKGNRLLLSRVGDGTESKASVNVPDSLTATVMTFYSLNEGSWWNDVDVTIANTAVVGTYNVVIEAPIDNLGTLGEVERFENVVLTPSTAERFIETVINDGITGESRASEYVTVDVINGALTPVAATYDLTGGLDGITGLTASDIIGAVVGQTKTGLQAFSNVETVPVNLLTAPGWSDANVINEILSICSSRKNTYGLVDPPFGLDVPGVIDWHNGEGYAHQPFNNSFAGLYWPWVKVYDNVRGTEIWTPPSGTVGAQFAYNDEIADPWYAAAGLNRGYLDIALGLEMSPELADRDDMYSGGNAVNPLVEIEGEGIYVWGQKTLQRRTTALDRANVRRMLIYLEQAVAGLVRYRLFEPGDDILMAAITVDIEGICQNIKSRRALYDYRVVCDRTTTTDVDLDNNTIKGRVLLKPTKTAEIIALDFVLVSTGASFTEIVL